MKSLVYFGSALTSSAISASVIAFLSLTFAGSLSTAFNALHSSSGGGAAAANPYSPAGKRSVFAIQVVIKSLVYFGSALTSSAISASVIAFLSLTFAGSSSTAFNALHSSSGGGGAAATKPYSPAGKRSVFAIQLVIKSLVYFGSALTSSAISASVIAFLSLTFAGSSSTAFNALHSSSGGGGGGGKAATFFSISSKNSFIDEK